MSLQDSEASTPHGSRDVPWYKAQVENVSPECRELLEHYSHIAPDRVETHILEIVGFAQTNYLNSRLSSS